MTDTAAGRKDFFARAADAFAAVRGLDGDDRRARLEQLARDDARLADEVGSLLRHHDSGASMLDRPVVMASEGALVGRYRILSTIGEGGMGTVFLAEQLEPVRREVALKLIKLGMDTRAIVRRFEAERHVLARMEHPGIARIFDGGVAHDGRPFFVMELVRGKPVTAWCDEHRLDSPARIAIFLEACRAVQHAHQKGVIHRDLKPGNLLVTEVDGRPVAKVIDFGIAKALDDDSTGGTFAGGAGAGAGVGFGAGAGTPEYMSPEQAGLVAADGVDVRSDVYSLGVVLYELLTGTTPTKARTRSGATRRPGSILPKLKGNLDAIILKAVAHEPERRYESVAALADDLERHLKRQPVVARPAGAMYVATQFARRHTLALTASAVVLMALITGLALALWGMQRAQDELFASTVERGRLAGVVGDLVEARASLWDSYLERPDSPHAAWALRELYCRFPSVWTATRPGLRSSVLALVGADRVVVAGLQSPPFTLDAATGAQLQVCEPAFDQHEPLRPQSLSVSADGTLAAVGDRQGAVLLWSLETGKYIGQCAHHGDGSADAAFWGHGHELLTAGDDGRVELCSAVDPTVRRLVWQGDSPVQTIAVHAPTGQLAVGLTNGQVMLWKHLDESPRSLEVHTNLAYCLAFSPDGERLASGSTDRTAAEWDTRTGALINHWPSNNGTVRDIKYGPDGTLYVLGWWRMDRIPPGETVPEQAIAEGGWRVVIPRDGELIVSHGNDDAVRCWRTGSRTLFRPIALEPGWTVAEVVVAAGAVKPLRLRRGNEVAVRGLEGSQSTPRQFGATIVAVASSQDGRRSAVGLADGTVWFGCLLDDGSGWQCVAHDFAPGGARVLAVDSRGERVAYGTAQNAIVLVAPAVASPTGPAAASSAVGVQVLPPSNYEQLELAFTPDGSRVFASERQGVVRLCTLPSDRPIRGAPSATHRRYAQTVFSIAFAADGAVLLGSWTGPIYMIAASGAEAPELRGHAAIVGTLAAHPRDANLLLSGSMDGTVRLWHLGLQREVQSLAPFGGAAVRSVAFADGGQTVVACDRLGNAVSWPLYVGDNFIQRNLPNRSSD